MKFKEPNALSGVADFHQTFDLPIKENPSIPSKERCELRINLIEEELEELKQAIVDEDIVAAADAFCDLQYVLSGAILEFGLGGKFKSLFDEVQRSNMSKVCFTKEEAEATLEHYRQQKMTEGFVVQKGVQYLVYRHPDKKVLKSINYSEANLEVLLG